MPEDRYLIEIATAFNAAGVDQANASLLKMNAATLGLAAALGIMIEVGKAAIENSRKQADANSDLENAITNSKNAMYGTIGAVDTWIAANQRFIDDQYAAKIAIADFIRAGMTEETALKLMSEALNLAALKHISTAEAAQVLLLASQGNTKGLRDLGFTAAELKAVLAATGSTVAEVTKLQKEAEAADKNEAKAKAALLLEEDKLHEKKKVTDADLETLARKQKAYTDAVNRDKEAHKELTKAQDNQQDSDKRGQAVADALNQKLKNGKETTDSLKQSQQELNIHWQNFTSKLGPDLIGIWTKLNEAATTAVDIISIYSDLLDKIQKWRESWSPPSFAIGGGSTAHRPPPHMQAGGPVVAGGIYTVGEHGPETLLMGNQSGTVVPNGAGGMTSIHIHIDQGAFIDGPSIDRLTNLIAQRLTYVTGR